VALHWGLPDLRERSLPVHRNQSWVLCRKAPRHANPVGAVVPESLLAQLRKLGHDCFYEMRTGSCTWCRRRASSTSSSPDAH
jgi:hypothetical protein